MERIEKVATVLEQGAGNRPRLEEPQDDTDAGLSALERKVIQLTEDNTKLTEEKIYLQTQLADALAKTTIYARGLEGDAKSSPGGTENISDRLLTYLKRKKLSQRFATTDFGLSLVTPHSQFPRNVQG